MMTGQGPITLAFAGDGDVTYEYVKDLLNSTLGFGPEDSEGFFEPSDREITLIIPATNRHFSSAIETVLDWSAFAELPYTIVWDGERGKNEALDRVVDEADLIVQTDDVSKAIIEELGRAEGEAYLVISWGDGSLEAEELLDLANEAGIEALGLDSGLDHLAFRESDEPEAEPVEEQATPAKDAAPKKEEVLEIQEEELTATAADDVHTEVGLAAQLAAAPRDQLGNLVSQAIDAFEATLTALRKIQDRLNEEPVEEPKRGRGRPRKETTTTYLRWPEGFYTLRGAGRPPKGTEAVELLPREVEELRAKGLIEKTDD